jgi:hypothetical protein
MTQDLFKRGGPFNVRKTGKEQYSMSITLPTDEHGRMARECLDENCSPGYYKVKNGTGITEGQEKAYCPYCRTSGEPNDFTTKEQIRYAKDIVMREAEQGVGDMLGNALGLGHSGKKKIGGGFLSIEMSMKKVPRRHVFRPFEEDLLRTLVCPYCGLDHGVFGIAVWCPDCGNDIFMEHVRAEYEVLRTMLSDVDRRRESLGPRIAARDLENCLEDVVTIFEAVLKAMLRRYLLSCGHTPEDIESLFKERFRNGLQNPKRAEEIIRNRMGQELFGGVASQQVEQLCATFEKRHPITHNLGVVDRKYLEKAYETEREGREVSVSREEIEGAITVCWDVMVGLHLLVFKEQRVESE